MRGRSLSGTRALHILSSLRTRNISVICAMSKSGIAKYVKQTCAFNTTLFNNFLGTLQDHAANLQIGHVVIIEDNVPFYKSISICVSVQNQGNQIMFLSPYSPFSNQIENGFSKLKHGIRHKKT